jgi:hypothetical protein
MIKNIGNWLHTHGKYLQLSPQNYFLMLIFLQSPLKQCHLPKLATVKNVKAFFHDILQESTMGRSCPDASQD